MEKKEKKEKKEEPVVVLSKREDVPVPRSPSAQTLRPVTPSLKKTKSSGSTMIMKRPSFGRTPIIAENNEDTTTVPKKNNKIFLRKKLSGLLREKKRYQKKPQKTSFLSGSGKKNFDRLESTSLIRARWFRRVY